MAEKEYFINDNVVIPDYIKKSPTRSWIVKLLDLKLKPPRKRNEF